MRFSIIIPTRGAPTTIIKTIDSLLKMRTSTNNYEIIIVENNDKDSSILRDRITDLYKNRSIDLSYFRIKKIGASYARNYGVAKSKFEYIIFIDDDIIVEPTFIDGYSQLWQKYRDATLIGGKITVKLKNTVLSTRQNSLVKKYPWCFAHLNYGEKDFRLQLGECLFSANMSIKKTTALKEPFDKRLGGPSLGNIFLKAEDYELCSRLILKKEKAFYSAEKKIGVLHQVDIDRFSDTYLLKRHILCGIENALIEKYLAEIFPEARPFFVKSLFRNFSQTKDTLLRKYNYISLASYYLNKGLFKN